MMTYFSSYLLREFIKLNVNDGIILVHTSFENFLLQVVVERRDIQSVTFHYPYMEEVQLNDPDHRNLRVGRDFLVIFICYNYTFLISNPIFYRPNLIFFAIFWASNWKSLATFNWGCFSLHRKLSEFKILKITYSNFIATLKLA